MRAMAEMELAQNLVDIQKASAQRQAGLGGGAAGLPGTPPPGTNAVPAAPGGADAGDGDAADETDGEVREVVYHVGESEVHVQVGGRSDATHPVFILNHGASKRDQNAEFWEPHYSTLISLGKFYAVDMPGHGQSPPRMLGRSEQLDIIATLAATASLENPHAPIVLLGRSYGGGLVLDTLFRNPQLADIVILIAPGYPQGTPVKLTQPSLILWDTLDPVMDFGGEPDIEALFANKPTLFTFKDLGTHVPELVKPTEFKNALVSFIRGLPLPLQ